MFERYKADPVFKAYVDLLSVIAVLWFLILVALMFKFGQTSWLITSTILVISLTAVSILYKSTTSKPTLTAQGVSLLVATSFLTVVISELVNPEKTMMQHFYTLLNPSWIILIFALLGLKNIYTKSNSQKIPNSKQQH